MSFVRLKPDMENEKKNGRRIPSRNRPEQMKTKYYETGVYLCSAGDGGLDLWECKNKGWPVLIRHPFLQDTETVSRHLCLADPDCLEITSDRPVHCALRAQAEEADRKAACLADLLWEDGWRICAIGGSEVYTLADEQAREAGKSFAQETASTWLQTDRIGPEAVRKSIYTCSGYVSRHCFLKTQLHFGAQLPDAQEWLHYEIHLCGYRKKPELFYKHNGMKIACAGLTRTEDGWSVHGSIYLNKTARYHCIRFGAEGEQGEFLFYANPVTRGRTEHRFVTYGDVMDELEKTYAYHRSAGLPCMG